MNDINLLEHPNIPKPLHGLNPRSIMGNTKWDIVRKKVYERYNYSCACCGIHKSKAKQHQWVEAHEIYDINYELCIAKMVKIVALCHYCHSFIHSGLQYILYKTHKITKQELVDKLKHGINLLSIANGKLFVGTYEICRYMGVDIKNLEIQQLPNLMGKWEDWKLIIGDKEYKGKFKSNQEWGRHYDNINN